MCGSSIIGERNWNMEVLFSALVGVLAYWLQHAVKSLWISHRLVLKAESRVGSRLSFHVVNRSMFPVQGASVLISIKMGAEDVYTWAVDQDVTDWIQDGRQGTHSQIQEPINKSPHRAYIEEAHNAFVRDTHLCWAFSYHKQDNPPFLNLWSKESALCALANIHDSRDGVIEIASENCFYDKNKANTKAMVFLKNRCYRGTLKFISRDSFTVVRHFEINTSDPKQPLRIWRESYWRRPKLIRLFKRSPKESDVHEFSK